MIYNIFDFAFVQQKPTLDFVNWPSHFDWIHPRANKIKSACGGAMHKQRSSRGGACDNESVDKEIIVRSGVGERWTG
jgi:hypothetical protein